MGLAPLAAGLLGKAVYNSGFMGSVKVTGLPILLSALQSAERDKGRGIITVSNHISTLDDPAVWGILPWQYHLRERTTRWCLGAHDILFNKGPLLAAFFNAGQVLDTVRGVGVHQPAVDRAIGLLDRGSWVHLFGEGKVVQRRHYQEETVDGQRRAKLIRFKWGVGRIMMESAQPPVVIPMWITGFDDLMPEGRSKPWKFFPRPGQHVSITFGQPIPEARLREALDSPPPSDSVAEADMKKPDVNLGPDLYREAYRPMPWLAPNSLGVSSALATGKNKNGDGEELARHTRTIRAALTAIVREEVQKVGYGVAGLMLGKGVKSR